MNSYKKWNFDNSQEKSAKTRGGNIKDDTGPVYMKRGSSACRATSPK